MVIIDDNLRVFVNERFRYRLTKTTPTRRSKYIYASIVSTVTKGTAINNVSLLNYLLILLKYAVKFFLCHMYV